MADIDVMRYSDVIQPDDSIENLITQLTSAMKTNKEFADSVSAGARRMQEALGGVSGATTVGRRYIEDAAKAAAHLGAVYDKLTSNIDAVGRRLGTLRTRVTSLNGVTDEERGNIEKTVEAYGKLNHRISNLLNSYNKAVSSKTGVAFVDDTVLEKIMEYERDLKALGVQLDSQVTSIMKVQNASQQLNLTSSEGARTTAELAAATKILAAENRKDAELTLKAAEAKKILLNAEKGYADTADKNLYLKAQNEYLMGNEIKKSQLLLQINAAKDNSYNKLSLQYQYNKLRLNEMSMEERRATESGRELEKQTLELYRKMQILQEAVGNHRLSVGDYAKGFNMLGFQVRQVVRELPAAAVSLNTFFLAISNNIPYLIDEINKTIERNKILQKEGLKTVKVGKTIANAIFSWQTLLVAGLFVLSKYGKAIAEWAGQLIRGRDAVMSLGKALKNVTKQLKDTDGGNAKNIVTVMRLREQWSKLNTEAEKAKWLKDHQQDFRQLGLAVDSVNKAESLFVKNTSTVLTAYAKRAAAAAAEALAQEKIKKAIQKQAEAETKAKLQGFNGTGSYNDAVRQAIARDNAAAKGLGINVKDVADIDADVIELIDNLARLQNDYEDAREAANSLANSLVQAESGPDYTKTKESKEKLDALAKQIKDTEDLIKRATGAQVIDFSSVRVVERRFRDVRNLQRDATKLLREGMQYFEIMRSFEEEYDKLLEEYGFGGGKKGQKNITEPENAMDRKVKDEHAQAQADLITSQYDRLEQELKNKVAKKRHELEDIISKNNEWLRGLATGEYTVNDAEAMTGKTVEEIRKDNELANQAILAMDEKLARDIQDLQVKRAIDEQKLENERIKNRLASVKEGSEEEYKLQKELLQGEENIAFWENWLNHDENMQQDWLAKKAAFIKKAEDLDYNWQLKELEFFLSVEEQKLASVSESEHLLREAHQRRIIELKRQIAQLNNLHLAPEKQQAPEDINKDYERQQRLLKGQGMLSEHRRYAAVARSRYASGETSGRRGKPSAWRPNEYKLNLVDLKQQKQDLEYQLELWRNNLLELSDEVVASYEEQIKDLSIKIKKAGAASSFADHGLFGGILEQMGFDHEQIDALEQAKEIIIDAINEIAEAEVEAAEKAVEAQQERVDAAQSAYDAEVQARANGYANNVATAKKEMEAEKKRLAQKQKLLEQAERRKEALDSLSQVSSLVTATAQIWQAFSGIGPWGIALAAVATAGMFAAFVASKAKAKQVASAEYGEGGLEFLEGGSHASGNDIDLGVKNRRGRRMKAEGGEAMAIINRRQTKRYRKVLPDIVDSLNKGVFEDKYLKAFDGAAGLSLQNNILPPDLSKLERDVAGIRRANEEHSYMMPDGTLVVQKGNVKRYIRR